MSIHRRQWLQTTIAASAAITLPARSYARVMGTNEKIRAAVIGLNNRGRDHLNGLSDHVVAVCDCDRKILEERSADMDVAKYVDFRKLLDQNDIDAVSIATPNHTHSLIGVLAAQAGKHVYCEKPISHNVWEGRQLVNAAERYGVVIQCGTQSRSSPSLHEAVKFVESGRIGNIMFAIGTCYKPRKSIGKLSEPLKIPETIDYELWCGPAEKRPIYRPKLHYDWHWDFNTGNGDMGNQGIHQMDIARWFLGYDHLSPRILSIGGRLGYEDAGDTPNTQVVIHDYAPAPLIFETRGLPKAKRFQKEGWGSNMDNYRGSRIGVIVQCEQGFVVIPSYTAATAYDAEGQEIERWSGGGNHYANFLDAVEAGDPSRLNAPISEGHLSSALCHTGNLSHQLGHRATLDEIQQVIDGEADVFQNSYKRMIRHLRANEVDLSGPALTLGMELTMDPDTETFPDQPAAAERLTRPYRKGFEVPDLSPQTSS